MLEESVEDGLALAQVKEAPAINGADHASGVDTVKGLRDLAHVSDIGHCSDPQPHLEVTSMRKFWTISAYGPLDASPYYYLRRRDDVVSGSAPTF
jgi:hypothetical protein